MEKIDVLMTKALDIPFFQVDINSPYVPIQYPVDYNGILYNSSDLSRFTNCDNIQLLSYGFRLPLSFELWQHEAAQVGVQLPFYQPAIYLVYLEADGAGVLPFSREFTGAWFLDANYECQLDVFVPFPAIDAGIAWPQFRIAATFNRPVNISMLNVPSDLDGLIFSVPIFIKVKHNINLVGEP